MLRPKNAAIYIRSNGSQVSEEEQETSCRSYAAKHKLAIVKVYLDRTDRLSSTLSPTLKELLSYAQNERLTVVLVHRLARVASDDVSKCALEHRLIALGTDLVDVRTGQHSLKGIRWWRYALTTYVLLTIGALILKCAFGSYSLLRDFGVLAIVFAIAGYTVFYLRAIVSLATFAAWFVAIFAPDLKRSEEADEDYVPFATDIYTLVPSMTIFVLLIAAPFVTWLGISSLDAIFERHAVSRDPSRWATLHHASRQPLGVALSGGGFRAALMHAGVLDGLEEAGIVPSHLSTVSGGSIIGAFYASGGAPKAFRDAVSTGRFNLKADLLDVQHAVRLLSPTYSRTDVQAASLDRILFGGTTLDSAEMSGGPLLMIAATDLEHRQALGIARDGVVYESLPDLGTSGAGTLEVHREPVHFNVTDRIGFPGSMPTSRIVAGSGAFPGAFPALTVARAEGGLSLIDGGVFDNLGLSLLMDRYALSGTGAPRAKDSWHVSAIIVSDGGARFSNGPSGSELAQTMDVIYGSAACSNVQTSIGAMPVIRLTPDVFRNATWKTRLSAMAELAHIDRDEVGKQCAAGVTAFDATSTLNDHPGKMATALFMLGQCLVWWNMPEIRAIYH